MQELVVGSMGEVDIIAGIDGGSSFLERGLKAWYLVDGGIVAHHHSVESEIAPQYVGEDPMVCHAVGVSHGMVARHEGTAILKSYHCLVRQYYLFHEFFFLSVASSAISEIVFCTSTHTLFQVALL